jgi:hypothetical protein
MLYSLALIRELIIDCDFVGLSCAWVVKIRFTLRMFAQSAFCAILRNHKVNGFRIVPLTPPLVGRNVSRRTTSLLLLLLLLIESLRRPARCLATYACSPVRRAAILTQFMNTRLEAWSFRT